MVARAVAVACAVLLAVQASAVAASGTLERLGSPDSFPRLSGSRVDRLRLTWDGLASMPLRARGALGEPGVGPRELAYMWTVSNNPYNDVRQRAFEQAQFWMAINSARLNCDGQTLLPYIERAKQAQDCFYAALFLARYAPAELVTHKRSAEASDALSQAALVRDGRPVGEQYADEIPYLLLSDSQAPSAEVVLAMIRRGGAWCRSTLDALAVNPQAPQPDMDVVSRAVRVSEDKLAVALFSNLLVCRSDDPDAAMTFVHASMGQTISTPAGDDTVGRAMGGRGIVMFRRAYRDARSRSRQPPLYAEENTMSIESRVWSLAFVYPDQIRVHASRLMAMDAVKLTCAGDEAREALGYIVKSLPGRSEIADALRDDIRKAPTLVALCNGLDVYTDAIEDADIPWIEELARSGKTVPYRDRQVMVGRLVLAKLGGMRPAEYQLLTRVSQDRTFHAEVREVAQSRLVWLGKVWPRAVPATRPAAAEQ